MSIGKKLSFCLLCCLSKKKMSEDCCMPGMRISNCLGKDRLKASILALVVLTSLSFYSIYGYQTVDAKDSDLDLWIYHSGEGTAKVCLSSSGYEKDCNVYELGVEISPIIVPYEIEDPKPGKEFKVCYDIEDTDIEDCNIYEFEADYQKINLYLPNYNSKDTGSPDQIGSSVGLTHDDAPDIYTYGNSTYGVKIDYPANFEKSELDYNPDDRVIDIVTFFQPFQDANDAVQEYYGILLDPIPYTRSLDEYLVETIKGYQDSFDDYKTIASSTDATLGGHPAYKLIYSYKGTDPNALMKVLETGSIVNGKKVYYAEYVAEAKEFEKNLSDMESLINSFQIKQK